ncbi:hypothetical protein MKW92_036022 [Papaver armeniacum]|nr:hypothetical protein MKW92_036022 [Papaver armeniacum]
MINLIRIICGGIVNRFLHFCLLFFVFQNCYAIDNSTITPTQAITDSQTITSTGGVFKLGFFSPPNSTHRYVGIWYEFDPRTIVWSFDHPTNTLLPGMNIGGSRITGKKLELTSWKSESDPSTGIFSAGPELSNANNPQLIIWRNESNSRLWRSGPWNKIIFIGIAEMSYGDAFYSSNQEDSMYISFRSDIRTKMHPRFVLDHHGAFIGKEWDANLNKLSEFWSSRSNFCDTYGMCGPFGSCNPSNSPICSCLIGFRPKFEDDWSKENWSGGCVRITQLECQNSSFASSDTADGFIKLGSMKIPDYAIASLLIIKEMEECNKICLLNCSCLAYSYDSGIGCMTWGENLVDIQQFTRGGEDLHIRLARSDIDLALKNSTDPAREDNTDHGLSQNVIVILVIVVLVGTLAISICTYFFCKWLLTKQRGKVVSDLDNTHEETPDNPDQVKVFKFQELAIATNNFDGANMLGQGGFGQVYKAWQLWNESKLELLIDPAILHESTPLTEIFRCIQVGLLCVQECARDRPNMSTTLSMLTSEIATLPTPKQPAFIERRDHASLDSPAHSLGSASVNHLTITHIEGQNSTITPTQAINNSQTLISAGRIFKLGFFSPPNSTYHYVGIWYKFDPRQNIVWVANRNNPLKDSSGTLRIADDGNLVISDGRGVVYWTTNVSRITTPTNPVAELLDTGNLVFKFLNDVVWQSFDHPTDTLLPGMKIGGSRVTGKKLELTSWKSESDPSTGIFSAGLELLDNKPQLVIWRNGFRLWRSGPWNNTIFIGIANMSSSDGFNSSFFSSSQDENMYISFSDPEKLNTRFVLDHHGAFVGNDWPQWDASLTNWYGFWSSQISICDIYGMCGPFGSCNPSNSPICSCLKGFRPKFEDEWSKGNWSGGCVRITQLKCQNGSLGNSDVVDGFLKLGSMKVPDYATLLVIEMEDCGKICLIKCSCLAYSYASGIGCMTWGENFVDIQNFTLGGEDLYIRLAGSDIGKCWFQFFSLS